MVVRMAEIYGCDLYAFLCSRRAGGMTGYRYAPVRVRSFRPDCSCVYGILVRKLEGERTVALTVIPGLSPDKEAVHRFAEWCGREQLDPARLPAASRAASMLTAPSTSLSQALGLPFSPIMLMARQVAQP